MANSDLQVEILSDALDGYNLDVIVTGSIGAVESPRFIRSLRRLGAEVYPLLSSGSLQFTTETACSWAASREVVTKFSGTASHIAVRDACLVTPASANIIGKIAAGITDTPESALIASYLGANKPVIVLPNMHDSLANSPMIHRNIKAIGQYCHLVQPRQEEGKQKFPEPRVLADEVAHIVNQGKRHRPVMIAMGTTRGYIDDVRYISNYSSGALGTKIGEEMYRQGFETHIVCGPCPIKPTVYSQFISIETNQELMSSSQKLVEELDCDTIFAASVLDYIPAKKFSGKLKSNEDLHVDFIKTEKILSTLKPKSGRKVGFKLEAQLNLETATKIANDYMNRYSLSLMVLNGLNAVDEHRHEAFVFCRDKDKMTHSFLHGKQQIAVEISKHLNS